MPYMQITGPVKSKERESFLTFYDGNGLKDRIALPVSLLMLSPMSYSKEHAAQIWRPENIPSSMAALSFLLAIAKRLIPMHMLISDLLVACKVYPDLSLEHSLSTLFLSGNRWIMQKIAFHWLHILGVDIISAPLKT
ncbi:hypothetical protein HETIRDRAFT_427193 [Heterobasidion irregulare TC 32-1]|uniref:Uncharacterized protein n=1 Tax=Heterobasidion irregulare (strain TC 32-1) TaxID=747525 RepID=W4K9F0_HETIT|nr:uncharacterized protein HETIRDRAFT_427193 [Heterobasidion irregulare TC 32-1]ETW81980.1 hypothetical protein HETIRDRAFT_427193 [Heterobasidion irregulare TC 32-1]